MITLNLLPDVKLEYLRTKQVQARVISIASLATMGAVGLVVLVALWVYGGQTLQKNYLSGEIAKHRNELKSVPDIDKYLTIQNQLANLTALHQNKNDFSRLMDYLPSLNPAAPNNVTLTNVELTADEAGNTLSLQGEAKDYTGLNTFRDTLRNAKVKYGDQSEPLFESVTVASSSLEQGQKGRAIIAFKLDTTYNPNAFLFSIKDPSLSVPRITTTQSTLAAPDVFGRSSITKDQQ